MGLRHAQPLLNQIHLLFGRFNSLVRFLLKAVQDIDGILEPHRVNRAVGVAVIVLDHLQHPGRPEPLSTLDWACLRPVWARCSA